MSHRGILNSFPVVVDLISFYTPDILNFMYLKDMLSGGYKFIIILSLVILMCIGIMCQDRLCNSVMMNNPQIRAFQEYFLFFFFLLTSHYMFSMGWPHWNFISMSHLLPWQPQHREGNMITCILILKASTQNNTHPFCSYVKTNCMATPIVMGPGKYNFTMYLKGEKTENIWWTVFMTTIFNVPHNS